MKKSRWLAVVLLVVALLSAAGWFALPTIRQTLAKDTLDELGVEFSELEFVKSACGEDIGTVKLFLDAGINVNVQSAGDDRQGNTLTTPLHCAASRGNLKMTALLLKHAAAINAVDQRKMTPLMLATATGPNNAPRTELIKLLLDNGAQINTQTEAGTALHAACRSGSIETINFLLERGVDPALRDKQGEIPMQVCIASSYRFGRENAELPIDKLLAKGVDINAANQNGMTMLDSAIQSGNRKFTEKLLALGADVNHVDRNGITTLMRAVNNKEIFDLLVAKGADINQSGANGSALHMALRSGSPQTVLLLLDKGASPNTMDGQGNTPLHLAAQSSGGAATIKPLIAHGASPNAINLEGNTPLHIAVQAYNSVGVDVLLANGAQTNIENNAGQTPLALLKAREQQRMPYMTAPMAPRAVGSSSMMIPAGEIERRLKRR